MNSCIADMSLSVILRGKSRRGHQYWFVVTSRCIADEPWEQTRLYLGSLDRVDPPILEQKRCRLRALGDPVLALQFDALLVKLGHPAPLPSLRDVDLAKIRS